MRQVWELASEKNSTAKMIGSPMEMKKIAPLGIDMKMCLVFPGNIGENIFKWNILGMHNIQSKMCYNKTRR